MNTIFQPVGCTVAAVGMHLILAAQLLVVSTSLVMTSSHGMQTSEARQINFLLQEQEDSPDMGGREGVPPSSGSGSR